MKKEIVKSDQLMCRVGKYEILVISFMDSTRDELRDCLKALVEFFREPNELPFYRTGSSGEQIIITPLDENLNPLELNLSDIDFD
jgi:hypothetical protein